MYDHFDYQVRDVIEDIQNNHTQFQGEIQENNYLGNRTNYPIGPYAVNNIVGNHQISDFGNVANNHPTRRDIIVQSPVAVLGNGRNFPTVPYVGNNNGVVGTQFDQSDAIQSYTEKSAVVDGCDLNITKSILDQRYASTKPDKLIQIWIQKNLSYLTEKHGGKSNKNGRSEFKKKDITNEIVYFWENKHKELTELPAVFGPYHENVVEEVMCQVNDFRRWLNGKGAKKGHDLIYECYKDLMKIKGMINVENLSSENLRAVYDWNRENYGEGGGIMRSLNDRKLIRQWEEECAKEANKIMNSLNIKYHNVQGVRNKNRNQSDHKSSGFIHKCYWAGVMGKLSNFKDIERRINEYERKRRQNNLMNNEEGETS